MSTVDANMNIALKPLHHYPLHSQNVQGESIGDLHFTSAKLSCREGFVASNATAATSHSSSTTTTFTANISQAVALAMMLHICMDGGHDSDDSFTPKWMDHDRQHRAVMFFLTFALHIDSGITSNPIFVGIRHL
jgi:hypothetical protein